MYSLSYCTYNTNKYSAAQKKENWLQGAAIQYQPNNAVTSKGKLFNPEFLIFNSPRDFELEKNVGGGLAEKQLSPEKMMCLIMTLNWKKPKKSFLQKIQVKKGGGPPRRLIYIYIYFVIFIYFLKKALLPNKLRKQNFRLFRNFKITKSYSAYESGLFVTAFFVSPTNSYLATKLS